MLLSARYNVYFVLNPDILLTTLIPLSMPFTTRLRPLVVSAVLLSGCSKSLTHTGSDLFTNTQPTSIFTTDASLSPSYSDSILYVQGAGRSAYLFKPVNTLLNGTFVSWPKGLTINPVTGEIDVLQSEPGARYNVGFVSAATGDTAYRQVILAGITYPDGIYDLSSGNTSLQPYFNANASATGAANSAFDQKGIANSQNLVVNTQTGAIDLQASVAQGLFGAQPQNGDSRDISIYYRLNDQSNMSLLKTTVTVYYFNSVSDIPQSLVDATVFSQYAFRQTSWQSAHPEMTEATATATPAATSSSKTGKTAPVPAPPAPARPPQVIIVNSGHH
jgi:hypothetical protein